MGGKGEGTGGKGRSKDGLEKGGENDRVERIVRGGEEKGEVAEVEGTIVKLSYSVHACVTPRPVVQKVTCGMSTDLRAPHRQRPCCLSTEPPPS